MFYVWGLTFDLNSVSPQDCDADFEVVNVMDEYYNKGVREGLKVFSDWPTIPQLYVNGEFFGGAEIIEEMYRSDDLRKALTPFES